VSFWQRHYGSIIVCSMGIMLIPQLFFQTNVEEFGGDRLLIALPVIAGCLLLGLLIVLLPGSPRIQSTLAGLGLAIVLCDMFFRAPLGPLDGAVAEISLSNTTRFGSLLVFFGLPLLSLIFARPLSKLFSDLAPIAALLAAGLTIYSVVLSSGVTTDAPLTKSGAADRSASAGTGPNIYMIWLDAMETSYVQRYLQRPENSDLLSGFTAFTRNNSNYLYTLQSYASFMSGTIYREGAYQDWANGGDRLRQSLKGLGYRVTAYAKSEFLSDLDDIRLPAKAVLAAQNQARHPFVADYVTYWLTRTLPAAFSASVLQPAITSGDTIHGLANPEQRYTGAKSIADGIEPLSGVFTLEQLIADEASRAATGEFVMAQAIIPHGPYVINSDCSYRGKQKVDPQAGYAQQLDCAMMMTGKFLAELARLDRLQDSIVVIMGDHGSGWAGLMDEPESRMAQALDPRYTPWSPAMVAGRAAAGLMIKPAQANLGRPLEHHTGDSQLMDLYPTLMTLLGKHDLIGEQTEGQALFDASGNLATLAPREKFITYFRPRKTLNLLEAEIYDLVVQGDGSFNVELRGPFRSQTQMPALGCGKDVSFGSVYPDVEYYRSTGLSGTEQWGRWSEQPRASVTFRLPAEPCAATQPGQFTLQLQLRGFISALHPEQSATVSLSLGAQEESDTKRLLGNVTFRHGAQNQPVYTFELPTDAANEDGLMTLEFEFATPVSPKTLGLSADPRDLAIGFESMQLR